MTPEMREAYYDLFRIAPGTETWRMCGAPSADQVYALFGAEVERLRSAIEDARDTLLSCRHGEAIVIGPMVARKLHAALRGETISDADALRRQP